MSCSTPRIGALSKWVVHGHTNVYPPAEEFFKVFGSDFDLPQFWQIKFIAACGCAGPEFGYVSTLDWCCSRRHSVNVYIAAPELQRIHFSSGASCTTWIW